MSKTILIENREKKFTSRKAAVSFVERGIAKWTSEVHTAIRFLEPEEQFLARAERQDEHYWREVAVQRGGGDDVAFHWELSISNGFVVRGAIPVAIHKRAQVAHVGTSRKGTTVLRPCRENATRANTARHCRQRATGLDI